MRTIKKSDWKLLRCLHTVALERYLSLFNYFSQRNKEVARLFDDLRRSTARLHIIGLKRSGLLTDEEFAQFSEETQTLIATLR